MANPYADALNRAGIKPGMARAEIIDRLNQSGITPDQLPVSVVSHVIDMGSAPQEEPSTSLPFTEEEMKQPFARQTGKSPIDDVVGLLKGAFKGAGAISQKIGRAEILPTIDDVIEGAPKILGKAGSTVADMGSALMNPTKTVQGLYDTVTDENKLAQAISETGDIAKRTRQGDLLGMLGDIAPGGASGRVLKKAGKAFPSDMVKQALDKSGVTAGANKIIESLNKRVGVPKELKQKLRDTVGNPQLEAIYKDAVQGNIKPLEIADQTRDRLKQLRGQRSAEFENLTGGLDLNIPMPEFERVVTDIRKMLEDVGAKPTVKSAERTRGKFDQFVEKSPAKEVIPESFSPYVRGDATAAQNVLDAVNGLDGSLGSVRKTLVDLSRAMNTKEFLNSGIGDLVYAKATDRLREAITDAATKYDLPQAKQLKKAMDEFAKDTKDIERLMAKFSLDPNAKNLEQNILGNMNNVFKDNPFLADDMALLEKLDPTGELITAIAGINTNNYLPAAARSELLGTAQAAGMIGLSSIFGGIPAGVIAAPVLGALSPRLIRNTTRGIQKINNTGIPQAGRMGARLTGEAGLGLGAASRFNDRGEDILTQLGRVQR